MRIANVVAGALLRATLSFAYWVFVFFLFYGAIAGDRRGYGESLTFWDSWALPILIVGAAILIHAALLIGWERRRRA